MELNAAIFCYHKINPISELLLSTLQKFNWIIKKDWIFFADDDIEIATDFLENCLKNAKKYKQKVFSLSCLLRNEKKHFKNCFQWVSFGSGASFANIHAIKW